MGYKIELVVISKKLTNLDCKKMFLVNLKISSWLIIFYTFFLFLKNGIEVNTYQRFNRTNNDDTPFKNSLFNLFSLVSSFHIHIFILNIWNVLKFLNKDVDNFVLFLCMNFTFYNMEMGLIECIMHLKHIFLQNTFFQNWIIFFFTWITICIDIYVGDHVKVVGTSSTLKLCFAYLKTIQIVLWIIFWTPTICCFNSFKIIC
jgi:hypothetical protein